MAIHFLVRTYIVSQKCLKRIYLAPGRPGRGVFPLRTPLFPSYLFLSMSDSDRFWECLHPRLPKIKSPHWCILVSTHYLPLSLFKWFLCVLPILSQLVGDSLLITRLAGEMWWMVVVNLPCMRQCVWRMTTLPLVNVDQQKFDSHICTIKVAPLATVY